MMRQRLLFLLTFFIVFFLISSSSQEFLTIETRLEKLEPGLKRLVHARSPKKVRVIVWLNKTLPSTSFEELGKVKYKYNIISAVSMEVSVDKLKDFEKLSNVKRVTLAKEYHVLREDSIPLIKADTASIDFSVDGTGINISIIDTGIYNHSEFQTPNRIIKQKCYCSITPYCPDGNTESDNATDDESHGTHCAGIAAGEGTGYSQGVATNASLFAVKVMNSTGSGIESDILAGIDWAVDNGAKVISLSLGGAIPAGETCYSYYSLPEAVDNATKQGVVVVVAAGNSGPSSETIEAPACAKRAITVGNTNDNDDIRSSSSRGPTKYNRTKPDLTAPGVSINSTINSPNGYQKKTGTSMSTPHVAGVAALVLQEFKQINGHYPDPDRVKAILLTAVNTTGMEAAGYEQRNNIYGSGRIDAYEALRIINYTENDTISGGEEHHYKINVTSSDFKTTLYWPEDKDTNNDLDLIVGNRSNNFSYTTDANDSVEQVFLDVGKGFWNVYVKGVNATNQEYFLASNMEIFTNTTPPSLVLIKPENRTYASQTNLPLNFTTDSTNNTIWYTVDGKNETKITGNTTFNVSGDGSYNLTLYVNDSYDNINQSTQYFSVDTTPPELTILSPVNTTYPNNTIWFNVSLDEEGSVVVVEISGANHSLSNSSMTDWYYLNDTLSDGSYSVHFFANDTSENMNDTEYEYFTIDTSPPSITNPDVDKPLVFKNETVNITATIADIDLSSAWVNVTWPNGISDLRDMNDSSSLYYYEFNETNQTGTYDVIIFANDTLDNETNSSLSFKVVNATNVSSSVSNGTVAIDVSVKIFYNGTDEVRNQTTNSSFEFLIPAGLWDLELNTTELNVTLSNVNLTQNLTRDIKLNDNARLYDVTSDVNTLKIVGLKFYNFTFSSANLTFFFNQSLVINQNNLIVHRCGDWNFTNSSCDLTWVNDTSDPVFNATINDNNVSLVSSNLSAFSLSEVTTTTTSSTTTTTAPSGSSSSNGGDGDDTTTSTTSSTTTSVTTTSTTSSISTTSSTTTTELIEAEEGEEGLVRYWYVIPVIVIVLVSGVMLWLFFRKGEIKAKDEFERLKEKWTSRPS